MHGQLNVKKIRPRCWPEEITICYKIFKIFRRKWATFTYIGKETLYITNAFRHTDLKITFGTNNTLENLLRQNPPPPPSDKFSASGFYKLTCPDCNKFYMGQTGRCFSKRYDEHKKGIPHQQPYVKFRQSPP